MFESIEIRKAENGFILTVTDGEGETKEFVYDSSRKTVRIIRGYLETDSEKEDSTK